MTSRSNFRLVEDPLGPDALERPAREELLGLFAEACKRPPPDYATMALRRYFPRSAR